MRVQRRAHKGLSKVARSATVAALSGLVVLGPVAAVAQEGDEADEAGAAAPDDSDAAFQSAANIGIWQAVADARPVSPVAAIPGELAPTVPFSRAIIESTPGRSEAFGGMFYASEVLEEGILNTTAGDRGNVRPLNPFLIRCQNPDIGTGETVRYPPIENLGYSIYSAAGLPVSGGDVAAGALEGVLNSEDAREQMYAILEAYEESFKPVIADFGLQVAEAGEGQTGPEGGPDARVDCSNRFQSSSYSMFGIDTPGMLRAGVIAVTSSAYDPETKVVVSDIYSAAASIDIGGQAQIDGFSSRVHVSQPAEGDATIDYRVVLGGVVAGGESIGGLGDDGLVIAGTELLPADVLKDFKQQASEQSEAMAELATWGINLSAPVVEFDDHGVEIEAPALEILGEPGPAANELDAIELPDIDLPEGLPFSVPLLNGGGLPARVGDGRIGDVVGIRLGGAVMSVHSQELPAFTLGPPLGAPVPTTPVAAPPATQVEDTATDASLPNNGDSAPVSTPPRTFTPPPAIETFEDPAPVTPSVATPAPTAPAPAAAGSPTTPTTTPDPAAPVAAPFAGDANEELADAWLFGSLILLLIGLAARGARRLGARS